MLEYIGVVQLYIEYIACIQYTLYIWVYNACYVQCA